MGTKSRLLHLEDNPTDSELVGLALREAGLDWDVVRVESRDAFVAALEQGGFNAVVSDYSLPSFNGLEALRETRKRRPELAFLFFTGTLGEERAVEALKAGATDFVAKERRDRLAPALQRAVKEAEERSARRQAEEQYRLLFDSNPHPMWVFDPETLAFLAVNDATVRQYGHSRDELLGMTIKDIRPPEEIPALMEELETPAWPKSDWLRVWKHRRKDGSIINVETGANAITFQGRKAVLVLAHDVTEKKKLEAQLLQSQKMEAVGQLAGGVAHDFNNLLGVITGYTDLLLKDLGAQHAGTRRAEQIRKAADRAAGLTRQLLAFSRKQVLQPKVLDLNAIVLDVEKMLHRLIGEDIQLVTVLGEALGRVKADPGQIEQVIVNLSVNARDAMPRGGKLIIETANAELDGLYAGTRTEVTAGPYAMLAVSDTGHGMDTETMSHIFEPFYTTKEEGKGTGLGLSTVFGIVKQSCGHVGVYSEVGKGTTFRVYLPRVEADGEATARVAPLPEPRRARGETILLVEDADVLRMMIREMLESAGYEVLSGGSPEEALAVGEVHSGPIHLVLTDVVMPGISGPQLAERLKAARPGVKVVYMSGYTDEAIVHHGVLEGGTPFLQKPFTTEVLLRKVGEALDA
ncbi:MAG TPA: response regulator [Vicinamibacteria bacterium]|jgi:two-component system cell cycle sensor histidine kinase/response regulator CckA|nr:response regulator [Vicinamibacteria bacterium]